MFTMVLKLDARNVAAMGFVNISKLLFVYLPWVIREEVGERSGGVYAREKPDHDGAEDCNQENDLAVGDKLSLNQLVIEYMETCIDSRTLDQSEKRRPKMLEHRKKAIKSKLLNSIAAVYVVSQQVSGILSRQFSSRIELEYRFGLAV